MDKSRSDPPHPRKEKTERNISRKERTLLNGNNLMQAKEITTQSLLFNFQSKIQILVITVIKNYYNTHFACIEPVTEDGNSSIIKRHTSVLERKIGDW